MCGARRSLSAGWTGAVTSAYLDSYLDVIGRNQRMEAWQVRQVVHALRILLLEMTRLEFKVYHLAAERRACDAMH